MDLPPGYARGAVGAGLVAEDANRVDARMPGEGHRAKGVHKRAGSIAQRLQVGKFRLPLAGGLLKDELAVAKYLDLRRFRIEVLALDRL